MHSILSINSLVIFFLSLHYSCLFSKSTTSLESSLISGNLPFSFFEKINLSLVCFKIKIKELSHNLAFNYRTLYRLIVKLEDKGIIKRYKKEKKIIILDREKAEKYIGTLMV